MDLLSGSGHMLEAVVGALVDVNLSVGGYIIMTSIMIIMMSMIMSFIKMMTYIFTVLLILYSKLCGWTLGARKPYMLGCACPGCWEFFVLGILKVLLPSSLGS